MNPRKRRAIARAVLAGIPKSKLNSDNIRKFLLREKTSGRLDLTEENIQDILFPNGTLNKPIKNIVETKEETVEPDVVENIVEETVVEEVSELVTTIDEPNTNTVEEVTYSLDNTKSELQARADELGLEYKKSLSKSKLLELINRN